MTVPLYTSNRAECVPCHVREHRSLAIQLSIPSHVRVLVLGSSDLARFRQVDGSSNTCMCVNPLKTGDRGVSNRRHSESVLHDTPYYARLDVQVRVS